MPVLGLWLNFRATNITFILHSLLSRTNKREMAARINTVVADLRNGLGAIKLRPDIKKVTLMFSRRSDNAGARYNIYCQQSLMSGKHGQG